MQGGGRKKSRRWTFIVVPPDSDAPTRRVSIGDRPLRIGIGTTLVCLLVASIWSGANAKDVAVKADRLADEQRAVLRLHDRVTTLHD